MTINDLNIDDFHVQEVKSAKSVVGELTELCKEALGCTKQIVSKTVLVSMLTCLSIPSQSRIIDNQTPTIEFSIPQQAPIGLVFASTSDVKIQLTENLDNLRVLEDGWDGYNAQKPSKLAVKNASMLISLLDDSVLKSCSLFPSNDAGIYLQGKLSKARLTIFLNDNTLAYLVKGDGCKLSGSSAICVSLINFLNQGLLSFV